jgi:hypothetical protein
MYGHSEVVVINETNLPTAAKAKLICPFAVREWGYFDYQELFEKSWEMIPSFFKDSVRIQKGFLLFLQPNEILSNIFYKELMIFLNNNNIKTEQVYVCTGGFVTEELLKAIGIDVEDVNLLHNNPSWENGMERNIRWYTSPYSSETENQTKFKSEEDYFESCQLKDRKYKYICLNRRPREHRWYMLGMLNGLGLYNQGVWSFISDVSGDTDLYILDQLNNSNTYVDFSNHSDLKKTITSGISNLASSLPINLPNDVGVRDNDTSGGRVSPMWTQDMILNAHRDSYFSVVTESFFSERNMLNQNLITEKSLKPMTAFMPFVMISTPGTLARLRSQGYMTFEPWIDESYDLEQNPAERLRLVSIEITRLCNMTNEQLDNMIEEMRPVLYWNFHRINAMREVGLYTNTAKELLKLGYIK